MAENYKHLYAQMKKVVEQYQDEIVPGLRKMAEELGQRQAASSWISVKDRKPEEGGTYIVAAFDGHARQVTFAKWQKRVGGWLMTGARSYWHVTHWMPMPEPPKED